AAEARRGVEARELPPPPARQARFLRELAFRRLERRLALRERPGRQLEELLARRLPELPDERHGSVIIDCHNCDRAGMLHDLALVLAPALDGDVDQLAVVDCLRRVRLHARASLSTRRRSSGPNHGGLPAAAFSPTRS